MADFSYAWTGPAQVALTSAVDQQVQYRQIGFALINYLRTLCGYTTERACDGVTAGAGNNIVDETDIVWGTVDTENHSWIALRPPTGKGNPSGGAQHVVIIDFANAAADTTPQSVTIVLGHGPLTSNGDANSRAVAQNEDNALVTNMVPWTAPISGSICRYESSNDDLIFAVKADGELNFRFGVILASDPNNAIGTNTLWMFGLGSTGDVFTDSNFAVAGNFRALRPDATGLSTAPIFQTNAFALTAWPNGQESVQGRVPWRDIEVLGNGAAAGESRNFGLFRDVLGCPRNTPFNQADPNDDGGEAPYEWRSIGDIVVPSNADVT